VPHRFLRFHLALACACACAALACGGKAPATSPAPTDRPPTEPVKPFATVVFAGEPIAVLPFTLMLAADTLGRVPPLNDRPLMLAWGDSLLGEQLNARGPEVRWILPPELRKVARRAPSVAPDPDRMGQSILRAKQVENLPDPLRGQLRTLVALTGGRYVLVPAALTFLSEPTGVVRAELSLVLADTRTGKVVWRTLAWAHGVTPAEALVLALTSVFPAALDIR
jgi:hypothetical protein